MTGYRVPKLLLDKAVSVTLLVLLAPVFAVVLLAMILDALVCRADRGPLLYRERRVSRGVEFDLLKFRTLRRSVLDRMAADSHARQYEAEVENLTWAGRRVLKPWYLDELPQLWNVLRGDMSLVGPRPWPAPMVQEQAARGYTYRSEVVAGWTGPAQVSKGVAETSAYAALDLEYVEASRALGALRLLGLDLRLLASSVRTLLRGEGLNY
jgi:lipopolysaccharide/colanic/teichoic acid biosynthesis glycosyltransferase